MTRPWPLGFGWIIALLVLIIALIALITTVTIAHLELWLILGLAVAIVLG